MLFWRVRVAISTDSVFSVLGFLWLGRKEHATLFFPKTPVQFIFFTFTFSIFRKSNRNLTICDHRILITLS